MTIVSVSRWNIDQQTAQKIVREAAPLLKQQGAQRISLGHIRTGHHTGESTVVVTYENWESFGRAMEAQKNDQQFQQLLDQALNSGQQSQSSSGQSQGQNPRSQTLQERTILSVEEIS